MSSVVGRGLGDIGVDAQLLVAKWLDLRSLCRLERVSKSMRLIARHKSLFTKLRRVTLCPAFYRPQTISTNLPLLGNILIGDEDLDEPNEEDGARDEEEAKDEVKADGDTGGEEGKNANKPKKDADPMKIVVGYKNIGDFFPALLRHVLKRGAGLTSLEILGKEKKMGRFWNVDEILGSIQRILKKKKVKLTSLAITHVDCYDLKAAMAKILAGQAGTLETLVLGPVLSVDPEIMGAEGMLKDLRKPKLKALKHLFLSVGDGEGLEKWLRPLGGQLELLVVHVRDDKEEAWAEQLAAVAKKAGSTLERREELYRVVLASKGLDESALGEGALSVDFLKDRASLTAEEPSDLDSDVSFDFDDSSDFHYDDSDLSYDNDDNGGDDPNFYHYLYDL